MGTVGGGYFGSLNRRQLCCLDYGATCLLAPEQDTAELLLAAAAVVAVGVGVLWDSNEEYRAADSRCCAGCGHL